ncbi:MFS general substrate transporter [Ascodesmis nigricans]|uniref:MFS general substrate transporter n=1 Tax=Ascodesmis nigricans TaxID=341454 RepID=A0A4S2MIR5_9PEZI|nr:MFS general substrate transporter [Ascodesmis nigricans]
MPLNPLRGIPKLLLSVPKATRTLFSQFPLLPALLLFLFEFSELLLVSPRIRLLEASICRSHYLATNPSIVPPTGTIPEELCKLEPIQARLAYIRGWQVFCEAIPVMVMAIPWGAIADRVGRKKVLVVNFVGCAVHILWFVLVCHPRSTFPPEAVWASGFAFIVGGGPRTGGIMILALVTDSSSKKKRSERFYYTYSAFLVTELVAPPLSAVLMSYSSLAPFSIALFSLILCLPVLSSIPTRILPLSPHHPPSPTASPLLRPTTPPIPSEPTSPPFYHSLTRNLALLLLLHLLCPTRQELTFQILIPYTSLTFSLPIPTAGLLLSLIALSNLVSILLLLPHLSRRLTARGYTPLRIDILTAKYSCLLIAGACILLGWTRSLAVFTTAVGVFAAGFGVRLAVLSAVTKVVGEGEIGRWLGVVTVVEGVGEMIAAVGLQRVWVVGMGVGKEVVGYGGVWWVGAVVYGIGAVVVERVRG